MTSERPPLIGIIGRVLSFADEGRRDAFSSSQPYSRAVAVSGGLPVLLPPLPRSPQMVDAYLDQLDGVLLPGGGDIEPHRYGQQPLTDSLYGMVSLHDEFDLAMARAAIDRDMPILAICRGMQVLNVSRGGTLVQDLQVEGHWMSEHPIHVVDGTLLAEALGTTTLRHCYSVHHQGLDQLGDGIVPVAHDAAGMVEAVELSGASWVVGVQWHPEDTTMSEPAQQHLFDAFIARARAHAAQRV